MGAFFRSLFLTDLDNEEKPKRLVEASVNIVQVSVALNQGMISSYHLVHSRVGQDAPLGQKCVCVCVKEEFNVEGRAQDRRIICPTGKYTTTTSNVVLI